MAKKTSSTGRILKNVNPDGFSKKGGYQPTQANPSNKTPPQGASPTTPVASSPSNSGSGKK